MHTRHRSFGPTFPRTGAVALIALVTCCTAVARQESSPEVRARLADGREIEGRLQFDATKGPVLVDSQGKPVSLDGAAVRFEFADAPAAEVSGQASPFRIELGFGQRITGRLVSLDGEAVTVEPARGGKPLTLRRSLVRSIRQRRGEVMVLEENFEVPKLDPALWKSTAATETTTDAKSSGMRSLALRPTTAALRRTLPAPFGSGRAELMFRSEAKAQGATSSWSFDLGFRGPDGIDLVQLQPGWGERPGVVCQGGRPLAVQPISLSNGWHRLVVRFEPGRTVVVIDDEVLAYGAGPRGPLEEIRISTSRHPRANADDASTAWIDDLRITRTLEPTGPFESDPTQDELRLAEGDQIFGTATADARFVSIDSGGRAVTLDWSEVAEIHLKREGVELPAVEGRIVRAAWSPGGGDEEDVVVGAFRAATEGSLQIDVPGVGVVSIPIASMRWLEPITTARWTVLDAHSHHLGDQDMPDLDPVHPEGDRLTRTFQLAEVPKRPLTLLVDVLELESATPGSRFADELKQGGLVTVVQLNGQKVDDLNRHLDSTNDEPRRLRIELPATLLQAGENRVELVLSGPVKVEPGRPTSRDDFAVLGLILEAPAEP